MSLLLSLSHSMFLHSESISKALMDIVHFSLMPNHCHLRMICLKKDIYQKLEERYEILLNLLGKEEEIHNIHILLVDSKRHRSNLALKRRLERVINPTFR